MQLQEFIQKVQASNPVAGSVYDFSTRKLLSAREFETNTRGYVVPNKYEDPFVFRVEDLREDNLDLIHAFDYVQLVDRLLTALVDLESFHRLAVKDTQNIVLRLQWILEGRNVDMGIYAPMFRYASRYISHHMDALKYGFETGSYQPIPLLLSTTEPAL